MATALPEVGLQAILEGLQQFIAGAKKMEEAYESLVQAEGRVEQASQAQAEQTERTTESMKKQAQEFDKVALAAAAAGAVLTALIVKVTLTAARTEELGIVLNQVGKNIGKSAEEMAELEKGVRDMGITTQASRQALIQMVQAQIDLSRATELARLAQDAAVIAQIDSSEAFERLITVIQRGSPLMARTMGIAVDFQGAYEELAKQLGVTANELTQQQKIQARTNEVMENSEQIAGTYEAAMGSAGKQLRSMNRYVEELSNEMGGELLPVMGKGVEVTTDLLKAALALEGPLKATIVQFAAVAAVITTVGGAAYFAIPKVVALVAALGPLGIAGAALAAASAVLIYGRNVENALIAEAAAIAEAAEDYEEYLQKVKAAELGSWALSESLYEVAKAAEEAGGELTAAALTTALDDLAAAFGFDVTGVEWLDDLLEKLPRATPSTEALAAAMKGTADEASDAMLAVMADTEAVRELGEQQGYTNEALDEFVRILNEIAQIEIDTRAYEESLVRIDEKLSQYVETTKEADEGTIAYRDAMAESGKAIGDGISLEDQLTVARMEGQDALEDYIQTMEAREKMDEIAAKTQKEVVKAQERADKARRKSHQRLMDAMEKMERDHAKAVEGILEDIAQIAIDLEKDIAAAQAEAHKAREEAHGDMLRAINEAERDAAGERTELTSDLRDEMLEAWDEYHANLEQIEAAHQDRLLALEADRLEKAEKLAQQYADKLASIEEQYGRERESIEDKYDRDPDPTFNEQREELLKKLSDLEEQYAEDRLYTTSQEIKKTEQQLEDLKAAELAALDERKAEELAELEAWLAEEEAAREAAHQEAVAAEDARWAEEQATEDARYREEETKRLAEYKKALADLDAKLRAEKDKIKAANRERLADIDARLADEKAKLDAAAVEDKARLDQQLQDEKDSYVERQTELETAHGKRLAEINRELAVEKKDVAEKSHETWQEYLKGAEDLSPEIKAQLEKMWREDMHPVLGVQIPKDSYNDGYYAGSEFARGFQAGSGIQSPPQWAIDMGGDVLEGVGIGLERGAASFEELAGLIPSTIESQVSAPALPSFPSVGASSTQNIKNVNLQYTGASQDYPSLQSLVTLMEASSGG